MAFSEDLNYVLLKMIRGQSPLALVLRYFENPPVLRQSFNPCHFIYLQSWAYILKKGGPPFAFASPQAAIL